MRYQVVGAVTDTGATVLVRTLAVENNVRLQYGTDPTFAVHVETAPQTTSSGSLRTKFVLTGLSPGTLYYFRTVVAGNVKSPSGRFRTFPVPGTPTTFSFAHGSCNTASQSGPVWARIDAANPLLFLELGDLHYANITASNISLYRNEYQATLGQSAQNPVWRHRATTYVWDDHDFCGNDSDSSSPNRATAASAYREQFPHYPLPVADAIYHSFVVGRVRFVVTDLRYHKTPKGDTDDASKTTMGATQKAWFFAELLAAKAADQVVVWANSFPWIGAPAVGADYWGGYTTERREIGDFLQDNNLLRRVLIISGDMHAVAADDGTNSNYATTPVGLGPPVLHGAALDRAASSKGGPYSQGESGGPDRYGFCTITDTGGETIAFDWKGRAAGVDTITLSGTLAPVDNHPLIQGTVAVPMTLSGTLAGLSSVVGGVSVPMTLSASIAGVADPPPPTWHPVQRLVGGVWQDAVLERLVPIGAGAHEWLEVTVEVKH